MLKLAIPALLVLIGCSGPQGKPLHRLAPEINSYRYSGMDRISPGDLIQLRFQNNPEQWDQTAHVQGDGYVSFKGLDPLRVAGMLPSQVEEELRSAYALVITGGFPELTVSIAEQAPKQVYVMGEVGTPGPLSMGPDGELTFAQAIAMAGGASNVTAWLGNTKLIRWDPDTNAQMSWTIDARRKWWGTPETVMLQEYDVIYVPNTRVDQAAINLDNWVRRMIPVPRLFVQ
ncbi:MAG TPA: polysaccharide biosynthesis/export family protein [Planctomycetota bacterium]|nr:polysaccharide biosynthesis/export family protein [Planctomycetota bacterium]